MAAATVAVRSDSGVTTCGLCSDSVHHEPDGLYNTHRLNNNPSHCILITSGIMTTEAAGSRFLITEGHQRPCSNNVEMLIAM